MDIFLEYLVKKKNTGKDYAFIFGIILAGILLTYLIFSTMIHFLNLGTLGFILVFGIWAGVYWLLSSHSREYEYSVTNGELDIDVIIARRKRKHLLSAKTRQFDVCASVHDPNFQQVLTRKDTDRTVLMAASLRDATRTYFVDTIGHDNKKYRLFFEPTSDMLEAFKKYNPQNVHIYDLIEED